MPKKLKRHIWPKFPRELEAHLSDAAEQPSVRLAPFVKIIVDKFGSWGHHPRVLNLYMRQFDQPPPDALWSPEIETAAYAFAGLSFASKECTECTECNILRNVLNSRWTHVWEWMDFLYHNLLRQHRDGSVHPLAHSFRLSIEDIFIFLLYPQDPPILVLSTEGVLGLAITMWIQLAEDPPKNDVLSGRVISLTRIVMLLVTSPDTNFRELPGSLRLDKRRAAKSIFKPIQMSIQGGPVWGPSLPRSLRIQAAISMHMPGFYQTLPTVFVISNICDALSYAASYPFPETNLEFYGYGINFALFLLVDYSLNAAEGYSWVIYALRHNLLPLLLKSIDCCSDDAKESVRSSIGEVLTDLSVYSIYRPVLQCLRRETILSTTFQDLKDEDLRSKWSSLAETVRFFSSSEAAFHRQGNYTLRCVFGQCKQEKDPENIRRCTGCKMAWYCSKDCQKRDWVKHRNVCGENRPSRDPLTHPRTRAFFRHLLEEQMMSRQEAINDKLKAFRLASPTPQPLILLVDYDKQIPPEISIHAPEVFDQFTYPDIDKVPMLLPCIRVRYGARYRSRDLPLPSELSGQLFGWFDQPEIVN